MLQGRFHLYEGNDPGLVVQPVLLFQRLGARLVVLTNAAGGVDPAFGPGTLMVMRDHLNLTGRTPLLGPNADELGPRFPDLTDAWSPRLRARLHAAGAAEGVALEEGVYAGLLGPTYETPAEVRMLRALGADAVGMSTVLECIAARWVGLEVCGVSLVTNAGAGYSGAAADPRGGPRGRRARPARAWRGSSAGSSPSSTRLTPAGAGSDALGPTRGAGAGQPGSGLAATAAGRVPRGMIQDDAQDDRPRRRSRRTARSCGRSPTRPCPRCRRAR